ncbi:hypothetical protein [Aliikangiella sp. IMCC44359]|uniref:hypothetical protein n=1 Tax=Aliikangiella sp. IMCC44359 TaxID=3459125 RepID=UPI00403AF3B2
MMEGISDIKIVSLDELRPPRIRKEPYINLYFKLSHSAPKRWCADFTQLTSKSEFSVKIDSKKGEFIETWVRKPEQIEKLFQYLKENIKICNENYIARIHSEAQAEQSKNSVVDDEGEQGQLNKIIANLNFDD